MQTPSATAQSHRPCRIVSSRSNRFLLPEPCRDRRPEVRRCPVLFREVSRSGNDDAPPWSSPTVGFRRLHFPKRWNGSCCLRGIGPPLPTYPLTPLLAPSSVAMFCGSDNPARHQGAVLLRAKPAAAVGTSGLGGEGTERHPAVQLTGEIGIDDVCFVVI